MRKLIFVIGICLCACYWNCQDVTIGYLLLDDAVYNPDSLVIKTTASLDTAAGVENPAVGELLLEIYGLPIDYYYSVGYTLEQLAAVVGVEPYFGRGDDYMRGKWGMPWVSTPIEGVDGTPPIYVAVKDIKSVDGDVDKLKAALTVRGDSTFSIPLYHDIPVGRYVITLNFSNEGYSKDLENCFTIIVK